MIIKTRNICSSIIKAIAQELKLNAKKIDKSNSERNALIMCSVSSDYLKSDLLQVIESILTKYQKHLPIETQCTVNCNDCDTALKLGTNTQLYSYCTHIGGMLYDESYVRNQHDGFCLVVDVNHIVTDMCDNTGSLLISVSANNIMDI